MLKVPKAQRKHGEQAAEDPPEGANLGEEVAAIESPSKPSTDGELECGPKKRKRCSSSSDDPLKSASKRGKARRRSDSKSHSSSTSSSVSSAQNMRPNSDSYCWVCHKEGVLVCCDVCPRSYHLRCIGLSVVGEEDWVCPECELVLRAENTDTRSPAMQLLELDQLCALLKFALGRMKIQCPEEFLRPVPLDEFPTYSNFVIHPIDVSTLEKNIKQRMYGSTESFLIDAKWILHNCIIYNGFHHKLTSVAKAIIKVCQQEMAEIEVCPDCYHNAHTKRENWFQETCNLPHLLVWAKLKGFPFWPGKAMKIMSGVVDVRFFGAHDRAWIPVGQCYLLSKNIPTPLRTKKRVFEQSMDELEQHVRKLKEKFGEFQYAPPKTRFQAKDVLSHLQNMLPKLENPSRLEGFLLTREEMKSEDDDDDETRAVEREVADDVNDVQTRELKTRESSVKNLETTIEKIKAKGSCSGDRRNDESMPTHLGDTNSNSGSNSRSGEDKESRKPGAASLHSRSSVAEECSGDEYEKMLAFNVDYDCGDDRSFGVDFVDLLPMSKTENRSITKASSSGTRQHSRLQSPLALRMPSIYDGVGKYSKKMTEFMHETMDEMFRDLTSKPSRNSSHADRVTIKKLEFEIERLKWQHRQAMVETKHNNDLVLMEMRNSLEAHMEHRVAQVRRQCELSKTKAIMEVKKKQWCALCGQEANFYCCWNTSYCDYPCQESHWPIHVKSCTQAAGKSASHVQVKSSTARHDGLVRAARISSSR